MIPKYHINLFWSEPDGAWVADVPDLQSCSAFGDTPAGALAAIEQAIKAWLAVAREASDRAQPQPHSPWPPHAPPRPASALSDNPGASSSVPLLEKLSPLFMSHFWGALQSYAAIDASLEYFAEHGGFCDCEV